MLSKRKERSRPWRLEEPGEGVVALKKFGLDESWVMSAIASTSDPMLALADSGATNALRPATGDEP